MIQTTKYKNKRVLVLGMAKSGYAAAKILHRLGASVIVNDRSSLEGDMRTNELKALGIDVVAGGHPAYLVDQQLDLIVKNPGIPYNNPLIEAALKRHITIITEVELAAGISEADFIGITGSNGKTTTTMLIGEMMKASAYQPIVAGNIGTVLCEVAAEATNKNIIVSELSSFQLMGVETFHPKVSVFLNLFEAHLDYHETIENYGCAKGKITVNQTANDVLIYNADDPRVVHFTESSKAKRVPFSVESRVESGAYLKDQNLYFQDEKIISAGELAMPGKHSIENALAAIAVAKVFGVDQTAIHSVLSSFSGVRHRLQFVSRINGRSFYNDSKATNVLATEKALTAFDQPVILLAGGLDRGNGFDALIPFLSGVKAVITFGETKNKIAEIASQAGIKIIETVDNVEAAVPVAYQHSNDGDIILLSPACASWDQYESFEQRGDMFINRVHMLK